MLRRERFTIDNHDLSIMSLAEGFKVAISETDESIPVSDDHTPNLSKFYHLHEPIELFALVIESTATILHPFIDLDGMLFAVRFKCIDLIHEIGLLCNARHPGIDNG